MFKCTNIIQQQLGEAPFELPRFQASLRKVVETAVKRRQVKRTFGTNKMGDVTIVCLARAHSMPGCVVVTPGIRPGVSPVDLRLTPGKRPFARGQANLQRSSTIAA
eukprot:COSAG02_NODE_2403_length_8936_cov_7.795519_4_plen_106_part_00